MNWMLRGGVSEDKGELRVILRFLAKLLCWTVLPFIKMGKCWEEQIMDNEQGQELCFR